MNQEGKDIMKLYRAKKDRYIGGVCGGLGHYFHIDSNIVRLLFALSLLIGGLGLVMYVAALFIVPEVEAEKEAATVKALDGNMFWGILLMALGSVLLLRQLDFFDLFDIFDVPVSTIWALTLIGVGAFLLFNQWKRPAGEQATTETEPETDRPAFFEINRSRYDRKIAGVCSGIARFFEIDPTLVRLGWILLTLLSLGLGILLYLLAMLIFPEESSPQVSS